MINSTIIQHGSINCYGELNIIIKSMKSKQTHEVHVTTKLQKSTKKSKKHRSKVFKRQRSKSFAPHEENVYEGMKKVVLR